jgi:hypothetical protein
MATAKNMNELAKMIEKMAIKAMQQPNSETSQTVVETAKQHTQTDVYDVYTPQQYERTGELKESWEVENTRDGIAISNTREDAGKYIPEVIETGEGYQYDFEYNGKARPFIENTRNELRNSNNLTESLKRDLRNQGFNVK